MEPEEHEEPLKYGNSDVQWILDANGNGPNRCTPNQFSVVLEDKMNALCDGLGNTEFVKEGISRVIKAFSLRSTAASSGELLDKRYTIARRILVAQKVSGPTDQSHSDQEIRELVNRKMNVASPRSMANFKMADLETELKDLGRDEAEVNAFNLRYKTRPSKFIRTFYKDKENRAITELQEQNLLPPDIKDDDLRSRDSDPNDPYRYPNNLDKITRNLLIEHAQVGIGARNLEKALELVFGVAYWRYYQNLGGNVDGTWWTELPGKTTSWWWFPSRSLQESWNLCTRKTQDCTGFHWKLRVSIQGFHTPIAS